jgi:hypothetical protein
VFATIAMAAIVSLPPRAMEPPTTSVFFKGEKSLDFTRFFKEGKKLHSKT